MTRYPTGTVTVDIPEEWADEFEDFWVGLAMDGIDDPDEIYSRVEQWMEMKSMEPDPNYPEET